MLFSASNLIRFSLKVLKPKRKTPVTFKRWQIVRGDIVKIRAGSDKGKVGTVTKVHRKLNKVTVRGVNVRKIR